MTSSSQPSSSPSPPKPFPTTTNFCPQPHLTEDRVYHNPPPTTTQDRHCHLKPYNIRIVSMLGHCNNIAPVNFFLLRHLLGMKTKGIEKQGKVSKLSKTNIGSILPGARVLVVKNDLEKLCWKTTNQKDMMTLRSQHSVE
ncbi:hypothetical protein R6Q59_024961 [Mikania micrantha]